METYRGIVYPYQLDHMGHMNVQWYVSKFDEATWHLFARMGITPDYMQSQDRGMAAVEQTLRYKAEVMAGDLLVIESEISELKQKAICFRHRMRHATVDTEVATCDLVAVHIDRSQRESVPFPAQIRNAGNYHPRHSE